ncbi:MAG: KpsF/GutQ family sugar-phosphate isomerase [Planctomycetota bacterium]
MSPKTLRSIETVVSRANLKVVGTGKTDLESARRVLTEEAEAILTARDCLDEQFSEAIRLLLACDGCVVVTGVGKSGLIGQKLSATFSSLGSPSHFLHPTEALHGDLGRIRRGDVVLLLSHSGETEEVVALASILRQDRVPLISMSKSRESHLGRLSDAAVSLGQIRESGHLGLAPSCSTTAMLAVGDALALTVCHAKRFSAEDFHKSHPGGMLGQHMMPISDFLRFRVGENLAVGQATMTIRELLTHADQVPRRCGAILIVASTGELEGILTDADLRRLLVGEGAAVLDRPAGAVMTRHPKTATADQPIREAIQIIREFRLDELPILSGTGTPLGVLDVQDLLAMKLIDDS